MATALVLLSGGQDSTTCFAWALERFDNDHVVELAVTRELGATAEHTHSCYLGDRTHRHAWGYGCGTCPACELRSKGFARYRK